MVLRGLLKIFTQRGKLLLCFVFELNLEANLFQQKYTFWPCQGAFSRALSKITRHSYLFHLKKKQDGRMMTYNNDG